MNINRFQLYRNALFFNYKILAYVTENLKDNSNFWLYNEWYFVHIGFDKHWFKRYNLRYNGNTYRGIVVTGLAIGFGYNYNAERIE